MREAIEDGRKVMKTIVKCRLPEYVDACFGDTLTCCTLCATCSRKKDVTGRRDIFGVREVQNSGNTALKNTMTFDILSEA